MVAEVFGRHRLADRAGRRRGGLVGRRPGGGRARPSPPPSWPRDPYGAGVAAVLANVNDLAAMGAVPLAIVDTVVAVGRRRPPGPGGHALRRPGCTTCRSSAATSPSTTARRRSPPSAWAGPAARVGAVGDPGRGRPAPGAWPASPRGRCGTTSRSSARSTSGAPGWRATSARWPRVAADGSCVAAKDVSMAGLVGSLAMLAGGQPPGRHRRPRRRCPRPPASTCTRG